MSELQKKAISKGDWLKITGPIETQKMLVVDVNAFTENVRVLTGCCDDAHWVALRFFDEQPVTTAPTDKTALALGYERVKK